MMEVCDWSGKLAKVREDAYNGASNSEPDGGKYTMWGNNEQMP
jgi:hypothetical protein